MRTVYRGHLLSVAVVCVGVFCGADWTRFRGPDGNGVSEDTGLPVSWSATENVVWKTPLPGAGASSPIIVGERIFVTCYSGYGLDADNPGNIQDLKHHVVCLDRASGKILWTRETKADQPERPYRGFIALHGYASGTPVTDGKAVYAFFGRSGVFAYDLDGKTLWQSSVGDQTHEWGSGTSPILAGNLVIINASVESGSLVALDAASGKEVWRAPGIKQSWSTPVLVELDGGRQEVVVSFYGAVRGYDPATGKQLWQCAGINDYVCPSVITHKGVVYVTGGRRPATLAIRAGGEGDVTKTHVLWQSKESPKVPTPLYHAGLLYWVGNAAIVGCVNAENGERVFESRLDVSGDRDKVYASVVLADGKLYAVSRQGGTVVFAAEKEFKQLAKNDLGDTSVLNATPVVSRGQLLLRSDRFLYCIGNQKGR